VHKGIVEGREDAGDAEDELALSDVGSELDSGGFGLDLLLGCLESSECKQAIHC
jgi:hypothetical protein